MTVFYAIVVLILCLGIYAITIFNQLVRCRLLVREAASDIDVQLKKRYDLIPKIVDTVKGYARYEQGLLEKVTNLRIQLTGTAGDGREKSELENNLSSALKSVFAVAEAYPELHANENFLALQKTLSAVEDDIEMARRYYNGAVRNYNIQIQSFPNFFLSRPLKFEPSVFFEMEYATERQSPDVNFSA